MYQRLAGLCFVLVVALGAAVRAQQDRPVLPDLAGVVLFVAGLAKGSPGLAYLGAGVFGLGGSVVHLAHGNVGAGLGSFALRTGLPILGLLGGVASAGNCTGEACSLGPGVAGFALGTVAASLIDVTLLARGEVPEERPASTLRLAPALLKDGGGLALAMRF